MIFKIIDDLFDLTKEPLHITKILLDLGYNEGYNPDIVEATNYVLSHFQFCIEELDGFEVFPYKNRDEQKRLLYVMLTYISVDLDFEELLQWASVKNNKHWVNMIINDCVEKKKAYDLEKILELAYYNFLERIGRDLIEIIIKHSEE